MSEVFEELWDRLPEVFRVEDAKNDNALQTWLSAAVRPLDDLDELIERIDDDEGDSELVDPDLADAAWLPWIGMIRGIRTIYTEEEATRTNLKVNGYSNGTASSMAKVVQHYMIGDKSVKIYKRSSTSGAIGDAGPWDVLIIVKMSEWSVDTTTPVEAVIAAGMKPAGVVLHYALVSGATWADIAANSPTWEDWEAGTWSDLTSA